MKIQILGSGCVNCKKLHEITQKIVDDLKLNINVEYITDIQKIIQMGLMQSPVFLINDKPVMVGFNSDEEKIKEIIKNNI